MINFSKVKKGDIINKFDVDFGLKNSLFFDITRGGLLNGSSHENGGIKAIVFNEELEMYYIAEFEGKEFAVNYDSYNNNSSKINSINQIINLMLFDSERKEVIKTDINKICTDETVILNCYNKLCYAPYTFIVNCVSTKNYINKLISINK